MSADTMADDATREDREALGAGETGNRRLPLFVIDPRKWWKPLLQLTVTGAAIGLLTALLLWNTLFAQMPTLPTSATLWESNREPGVEFIDAKGTTLAIRGPRYGRMVRLADLPPHVKQAFIAAEDKRFNDHEGVDYSAIFRAFLENVRAGRTVQGGSTITQQLVKNLILTSEETLRRKAQEARLAIELEQTLSKDQILELYINRIYLGAGAYGLDAAAHTYFGTSPENLTLPEAAVLAALPKAPTRFSSAAASTRVRERQHYVLDQMVDAQFITAELADAAKRATLRFAAERSDLFSSHALDYALQQVHEILPNPPPDLVVTLTLDHDIQTKAEAAISGGLARMGASRNASEGAAVLLDYSGAIRAMVGGLDYNASKFNRAVQARRQPGSAFKTFVYAAALEDGMSPGDVWYDEPITIQNWSPKNYSGGYRGAITLSEAMAESVNTVAAAVGYEVGLGKVTELARRFGIRTQLHNWPSVALGSDEVNLLEITSAYGVIANHGRQVSPHIIQEIRNSRGDLLFQHPQTDPPQLYSEQLARTMTGLLTRVVVQGTGRSAGIPGWDVAGKTGTSQEWRDAWFIGFTSKFIGGVWVGNDDDTPMVRVTGGDMSAAIWADMVGAAQEGLAPEPLDGAIAAADMLDEDEEERLSYYRRLASAFRQVEARRPARASSGGL